MFLLGLGCLFPRGTKSWRDYSFAIRGNLAALEAPSGCNGHAAPVNRPRQPAIRLAGKRARTMKRRSLPSRRNRLVSGAVTDHLDPCERFVADGNTRLATALLAHKWDPVLLAGLSDGPRRRADLLAAVGGASDKSLTESLRRLTASGLVTPAADATARHVRYELTALGTSFVNGPLRALGRWAVEHGDEVVAAQERQPAHARR